MKALIVCAALVIACGGLSLYFREGRKRGRVVAAAKWEELIAEEMRDRFHCPNRIAAAAEIRKWYHQRTKITGAYWREFWLWPFPGRLSILDATDPTIKDTKIAEQERIIADLERQLGLGDRP